MNEEVYRNLYKILCILLLAEFVVTRTVTHSETIYDSNGNKQVKSWTANEDDDYDYEHNNPFKLHDDTDSILKYLPRSPQYHQQPRFQTFGGSDINIPHEELLKQAALNRGMNPTAVDDLLRTKQPVVTTTYDEQGNKHTTTYTLEPDGSVARKTLVETKPIRRTYSNSWNLDPTLRHPIEPIAYVPKPVITHPNDEDDVFERRSKPTAEATTVRLPENWDPNTWPQHNIKPIFSSSSIDTSPFDLAGIDTNTPGTVTKTHIDDNGNKITTTYTVGPTQWTHKVQKYPTQTFEAAPAILPTTTTTTTPAPTTTTSTSPSTTFRGIPTPTPLPPLDEFLRRQYGSTTTKRASPTTPKSAIATSTPTITTTTQERASATTKKPVKTITLEDLPAVEVLHNGKPVNEDFLKTLPSNLRPVFNEKFDPKHTTKIENIPRTNALDDTTSVRTIDQTINTPTLPTFSDMSPSVQDMLKRAGINPNDIKSIDGDTITKTRQEPDGRIVTTTYKVRKVPRLPDPLNNDDDIFKTIAADAAAPINPHRSHSQAGSIFPTYSSTPSLSNIPTVLSRPYSPLPIPSFSQNPIDDFLAKIGLSPSDIFAQNGEYTKTITDESGRILRVNFSLSLPKRKQRDRESLGDIFGNTHVVNPIK